MRLFRRRPPSGRRTPVQRHGSLERLLGPTEPQLSCEDCFAAIDRYVELEAAGRDASAILPALTVHLEGCPACKEEHDDLLAFLRAQ